MKKRVLVQVSVSKIQRIKNVTVFYGPCSIKVLTVCLLSKLYSRLLFNTAKQFFWFHETMRIHPLNVLNSSWSYFFLGAESHKPVMYNAFWE